MTIVNETVLFYRRMTSDTDESLLGDPMLLFLCEIAEEIVDSDLKKVKFAMQSTLKGRSQDIKDALDFFSVLRQQGLISDDWKDLLKLQRLLPKRISPKVKQKGMFIARHEQWTWYVGN